jgi:glycerophosphoryl diester phosphodiesterase
VTSVYAHRGSVSMGARENTLEAFRAAAQLGADGVELDVRRTADGALVVHHDIEVAGLGPVSAAQRAELPEWVPLFEEALAVCIDLGLVVNVEVKSETSGSSHDAGERCARESALVCESLQMPGRLIVSSFSVDALSAVRDVSAGLPLALLLGPLAGSSAAPWARPSVARLRLEGVHPFDTMLDAPYVARARSDGLAVRAWTVDDPERIAQLGRFGVDGVITNDVATAKRALGPLQPSPGSSPS